ncbi:MAG: hypothetical protein ISS02_01415 [Candidatus Portnoybacteria bacterium]|nr:hypothetical protein [Candidatus Portnoybacteria bacterium]
MKSLTLREKAINFRKRGYSYGMIIKELGVAKSTLSNWLQKVPYKPNKEVLKRIGEARMKNAETKRKQMLDDIRTMKQSAKKEVGKLNNRDLFMLGVGLYLGDGEKTYENIRITNSDPEIIKIAMRWFQEICGFKIKNFIPSIHLYPDNDIKKTLNYWSRITGIPKKQFNKTQIDRRSNKSKRKKRKLPYGTLHLKTKNFGKKEFGKSLHRRIMGWIEAVEEQLNKRG